MELKDLKDYLLIPLRAENLQALAVELKRIEWIFIVIRWLWVPAIFILERMHNPVSGSVMMAIGGALAGCNALACVFNVRVKSLNPQRAFSVIMLAFDMLAAWGVIFLFVNDFYTAAYAVFVYVVIEGAIRFGLVGSIGMLLSFILGLFIAYEYRDWQYGVRFSTSGFVYWTMLMTLVAASLGIVVNEWKRQSRRNECFLREKILLSERHRIAHDLHDTILKTLQGLTFEARALGKGAESPPAVKETARYIEGVCSRTSRDIRELIFDLRGGEKVMSIGALAAKTLEEWSVSAGIAGEFKLSGRDITLDNQLTTHISNIVSEALANIQRHSSASAAVISMEISDGKLTLKIKDDGRGIKYGVGELHIFVDGGRLGIAGMKERVESLGGRFLLESNSKGTELCFQIPVAVSGDK